MQVPIGTVEVIIIYERNTDFVLICCNKTTIIKTNFTWAVWQAIGPMSMIPEHIISYIGSFALELFLLESGLTQSNALLLLLAESLIYDN